MTHRILIKEELIVTDLEADRLAVTFSDGTKVFINRTRFDDHFWGLLEIKAVLTWTLYSCNGKVASAFTVRFPRLKGT